MNTQTPPSSVVVAEKMPAKMKVRHHMCPDARSTTKMRFCSAWSRRYGLSDRVG
jgi:hypothetical protein